MLPFSVSVLMRLASREIYSISLVFGQRIFLCVPFSVGLVCVSVCVCVLRLVKLTLCTCIIENDEELLFGFCCVGYFRHINISRFRWQSQWLLVAVAPMSSSISRTVKKIYRLQ